MSNNNHPHGHLSQAAQNPSWNPLQIPSYIPRQPQLAHMSNERSLVRSPLAWHASAQPPPPPPPDAIYNFMSANHKNLDHHHQMNPLLAPPYTGTLPFDSMDLSLQSSRSAAPSLNKTGQQQQQQQQQQAQQQQPQQSHLHAPPNYPTIHNLTTSAPPGGQGHLPGMPTSASPASAASKYLNANGTGPGDCESLLPPPPGTPPNSNNHNNSSGNGNASSNSSNNNSNNNVGASPHYMQSRDENFKLTQLKSMQKGSELSGKDCGYAAGGAGKLATHNMQQQQQQQHAKKPSPLRSYHQQQQSPYNMTPPKYNGPQTPPTPQSPLDYNQLHLHHQLHASVGYAAQQHQQHQAPPPPPPGQHMPPEQQHLHYAPPASHHNQHLAPPPPPISHMSNAQFQQRQQPSLQQQQQQQPLSAAQQSVSQMHSRNTQLTNLDALSKQKSEEQQQQLQQQPQQATQEDSQPIITDLSTTASYRNNNTSLPPPLADDKQLAEAPESPYMTTSNEESLESNSNSSNSRKRRKRKASQVMRLTPSDNVKRQRTPSPLSNSCSPKHSPKNGTDVHEFQPFGLKEKEHQEQPQENGRAASPPAPAAADNSNSSTMYNDTDNPKTKKQRQALLQRNLTEQQQQHHRRHAEDELSSEQQEQQQQQQQEQQQQQQELSTTKAAKDPQVPPPSPQSNSSSSSSSSSSAGTHSSHSHSSRASEAALGKEQQEQQLDNNKPITDTPASPALVEQGNIDAKPAVSVHDDEDEVSSPAGKQSPPVAATTVAAAATTSPTNANAGNGGEPCHFNEVEDKLEKMFAGIEDEVPGEQSADEPATASARTSRAEHDLSAQLALDGGASAPDKPAGQDKPAGSTPPAAGTPTPTPTPTPTSELRPMATKAAMKSTLPSPIHSPTPTAEPSAKEQPLSPAATATSPSVKMPPRTPPTRFMPPRRLSMGMDASLLRFTIEESKKTPTKKKQAAQPTPAEADIRQPESDDDKPSTSAAAAAALAARKLSEAAAVKTTPAKTNNNNKKKKNAPKGKKPTGKNGGKANSSKKGGTGGARKFFSTDEDSMPASNRETNNGVAPDLKFKSPYILIKPDGSVSIKNTHSAEDVNEKQIKKKHSKAPHERKNLRGMHSSTLSNRYDADTTDSSWICVFCKCGPHKLGLGDLFGPYLVSIDCDEYRGAVQVPAGMNDIDGMFVSRRKRADMVQLNERNLPVVPATLANIMQAPKITMHKRKRKQTHDSTQSCSDDPNESQCSSQDPLECSFETKFVETFRGMSKTSEHSYEIWLHEDCAVWANDIHLIGAHVNGLDAAVWDSTRYQCVHCGQPGATVCCFERSCKAAAHVPCARVAGWSLCEAERKVYCQPHVPAEFVQEKTPIIALAATLSTEQTAEPPPTTLNVLSLP